MRFNDFFYTDNLLRTQLLQTVRNKLRNYHCMETFLTVSYNVQQIGSVAVKMFILMKFCEFHYADNL